jgi:hypothetical protein
MQSTMATFSFPWLKSAGYPPILRQPHDPPHEFTGSHVGFLSISPERLGHFCPNYKDFGENCPKLRRHSVTGA